MALRRVPLALIWTILISAMSVAATPPIVTAVPSAGEITVDGALDEAAWGSGEWSSGFHVLDLPGVPASAQTRFKVRFDEAHLYVGIVAEEPHMDEIQTLATQRDGRVWADDCIEVMVDATGERVEYYHFAVNTAGAIYDAELRQGGNVRSSAWNGTARVAAKIGDGQWTAEIQIPVRELGLTAASRGDWALNVARERQAGGGELSTFAPLSGGFHQPVLYAALQLPGADFERYLWEVGRPTGVRVVPRDDGGPGDGTLNASATVSLTHGGSQPRAYELYAVLGGVDDGPVMGTTVAGMLRSEGRDDIEIHIDGIETGEQTLELRLSEPGPEGALLSVRRMQLLVEYEPLSVTVTQPHYRNNIYATESLSELIFDVSSDMPPARLGALATVAALIAVDADTPVAEIQRTAASPATLRLPIRGLAIGDYELRVQLVDPSTGQVWHESSTKVRKLPAVAEEWRIDENLVLRHNGEPVLPFGWFSIPPAAMADTNHAFETMQAYSVHYWSVERVRAFLDTVAAAGTAVTINPYPYNEMVSPDAVWGQPLSEKEARDLRERVRALKDHPGLFAWYMADEPELRPALPERCRQIYEIVRDEDPYHPCIMLNDTVAGIFRYREGGDILMPDPYPLFIQDGLAARPMEKVSQFMEAATRASAGRQAIWITPQGFNYGDYGRENNRVPNFTELRNQLYQAVVEGTRGFLWYTYSQVSNYPSLDIGMRWLSREVADLKDFILVQPRPNSQVSIDAPQPQHIHTTLRHVGDEVVLIVVNTATQAQVVSVGVDGQIDDGSLHVVSEQRRVEVEDGRLRDRFGIYEAHVYTTDKRLGVREDLAAPIAAIKGAEGARRKPGDLAFEDENVRVTVSSESQYGSTPNRVVDGITRGMRWRDGTPGELLDWLLLHWPTSVEVSRLVLHSDTIAGVEVQVPMGDTWVPVGSVVDAATSSIEITLPKTVTTDRLRLEVTALRPGAVNSVLYEVEAYGE